MPPITRFAPSPTGYLHVGNAYSALICRQWALRHHARLLLRIEDIDFTRCRTEFTQAILDDLAWLGMDWHGQVRRQSEHLSDYQSALERLRELNVIYPCFCTRRRIQEEINRMGLAPHGEDGSVAYPGTCRGLEPEQRQEGMLGQSFAWRLNTATALKLIGGKLFWRDGDGRIHPVPVAMHGDAVIGRKDIGISYHLAVVVDDAAQGVTHVIRGADLRPLTGLHRLLQALLGLPDPVYIHHPLLLDADGRRLAKRHGAPALRELKAAGIRPGILRKCLLEAKDHVWREKSLGNNAELTQHSM